MEDNMRVTSTDFQQNIGAYSDTAQREPIFITNHNRDRLVLLSVDDYNRLVNASKSNRVSQIQERLQYHSHTLTELSKK